MIIEMLNLFSGPPGRIIFSETLTALLFRIGSESHSAHSILTFLQKQKRQCTNIKSISNWTWTSPTWMQSWLVGRTSTPRLRLGVLASLLVNFALELHSVIHHRLLNNVDSNRGQVHLGCASVYLPPFSSTLHWSCTRRRTSTSQLSPSQPSPSPTRLRLVGLGLGFDGLGLGVLVLLLVQLQIKSILAKLKSNSASPRWTSTWPRWTWSESVMDHLVQLQLKSISVKLKSNSASPRWTSTWPQWTWAQVGEVHVQLLMDLT